MDASELGESHRQALAAGMVKVGLPMGDGEGVEWCFAERVSSTHARLRNVPVFCRGIHFGDVVEFREQESANELFKVFVRVKTQGSFTVPVSVAEEGESLSEPELVDRVRRVVEKLRAAPEDYRPLAVESVGDGWLVTAWPLSLSRSRAASLAEFAIHSSVEG